MITPIKKINKFYILSFCCMILLICFSGCIYPKDSNLPDPFMPPPPNAQDLSTITIADAYQMHDDYRRELEEFRQIYETQSLPHIHFYLFGMGNRQKMIYTDGALKDISTSDVIKQWEVDEDVIIPSEYMVVLKSTSDELVIIFEDDQCVWTLENAIFTCMTSGELNLPDFKEQPYPHILRVLHQEILINIKDGEPLPNFMAYSTPWYRDAASIAMVLENTNNLDLIAPWIEAIRDPFDRNNGGVEEADNLGQVLYLVSLVSDKDHPVVKEILERIPEFAIDSHIEGLTDFSQRPVYQTAWLKFGLSALGLDDPFTIPDVPDSYGALFWMDFRKEITESTSSFDSAVNYPYLTWAEDHFYGNYNGRISDQIYPLTWESQASAAQYEEMAIVSDEYVKSQTTAPHAWHAAEMFLALADPSYPW